jgi:hypothetical protein
MERPVKCDYERIGCNWEGPFHELECHNKSCVHPKKSGNEILLALKEKDEQRRANDQVKSLLINCLSMEKVCFNG